MVGFLGITQRCVSWTVISAAIIRISSLRPCVCHHKNLFSAVVGWFFFWITLEWLSSWIFILCFHPVGIWGVTPQCTSWEDIYAVITCAFYTYPPRGRHHKMFFFCCRFACVSFVISKKATRRQLRIIFQKIHSCAFPKIRKTAEDDNFS